MPTWCITMRWKNPLSFFTWSQQGCCWDSGVIMRGCAWFEWWAIVITTFVDDKGVMVVGLDRKMVHIKCCRCWWWSVESRWNSTMRNDTFGGCCGCDIMALCKNPTKRVFVLRGETCPGGGGDFLLLCLLEICGEFVGGGVIAGVVATLPTQSTTDIRCYSLLLLVFTCSMQSSLHKIACAQLVVILCSAFLHIFPISRVILCIIPCAQNELRDEQLTSNCHAGEN